MTTTPPVIFSYCATFLPREMLHVYRQVSGLQRFENHVVTRKRANPGQFPFLRVHVLKKPPLRFLTRLYYRARQAAVPVSASEIRQMHQLLAQHRAALAHIYLGTEALRVLPFLQQTPAARIVSFHGADLAHAQSAELYAPLWPVAELFLCRSLSLREELVARGCPESKIRLNYTGVPVPSAPPQRTPPTSPIRLLQVCRLIEKKGLDVSLQSAALLRKRGLDVHLTFAGEGPLQPTLRQQAGELSIRERVTFAGFLTAQDLQRLFTESHIFIHPSRQTTAGDREGIPNSLLEAMAAALPVIATCHSGIPEAIEHNTSGLLIDHADPSALASAIEQVATSPATYTRLSENAWRRVHDAFSTQTCISNLEALYLEAIAAR